MFRGTCDASGDDGAAGGYTQLMGAPPPPAIGKIQTATDPVTVIDASGVVDGRAHPGTIPYDPPALTAPSSDSSGTHGPVAPALAKPFVPGAVSAAPDKFIFAENAGHDPVAGHKTDMTEIDHPVPAAIQHALDSAHDANAMSPPDPNHANAPQDTANVPVPHHPDGFHFA